MSDEFQITYEHGSPDDPILHGRRWRRERDFARAEVERLRAETHQKGEAADILAQKLGDALAEVEWLRDALSKIRGGALDGQRGEWWYRLATSALDKTRTRADD